MPTYPLTAINVGSFPLGEADKVITLFSKERGVVKAVAKGARKPGAKISGKAEVLCVNNLLLAKGKSLDIITQAESIETFSPLRTDLERLTFGLYFAELTRSFGTALEEDSEGFFQILFHFLSLLSDSQTVPALLSLEFDFLLLRILGLQPQLQVCVLCRQPLTEYSISVFVRDIGGICCQSCSKVHASRVAEGSRTSQEKYAFIKAGERSLSLDQKGEDYPIQGTYITPLVWKYLVLASARSEAILEGEEEEGVESARKKRGEETASQKGALKAARNLMEKYLEDKAGRKMKSLDLLGSL